MLATLAFAAQLLSLAPQYATFGPQAYVDSQATTHCTHGTHAPHAHRTHAPHARTARTRTARTARTLLHRTRTAR